MSIAARRAGSGGGAHIGRLEVGTAHVHNRAGKLARRGVILSTGRLYLVQLIQRSRSRNALGEDPHSALVRARHPGVVSPPTISLFRTASSCQPSVFASFARCRLPFSPCSSPATATKTMVLGNFSLKERGRTRAKQPFRWHRRSPPERGHGCWRCPSCANRSGP